MVWIKTSLGLFVMWIKSLKFGRNSGPIVVFEGVFTQLETDLHMVWIRTSLGLFVMWIKSPIVGFEGVFTQLETDLHMGWIRTR